MLKDSIIILAWPQTPAKAIGRWYDGITKFFGFLKDGYYSAGHAAAVLVNHSTKELHYFDFGRYHMPSKFGRARDHETDPGLLIKTKLILSDDQKILNIKEILNELNQNKNFHGKGPLYASILEQVSFNSAYNYAKSIQNKDAVPYGPYEYRGTNCSRFITSIAKQSKPSRKIKFRLSASLLLTPLTKANVFACCNTYYKIQDNTVTTHLQRYKDQLKNFMLPFYIQSDSKLRQTSTVQFQVETI